MADLPGYWPDDLYAVQEELLDAAAASLNYLTAHTSPYTGGPYDVPLRGAPDRQYVAPPGDYVFDCEKLIVNSGVVGEVAVGQRGGTGAAGKRHVTGRLSHPAIRIILARKCIPVGSVSGRTYTPPTIEEEEAASRQLNADGWALWNGIFTRLVDEEIEFLTRCQQVWWDAMTPVGPQGAYAGWVLNLRVRLAGYKEPLGS